MNEMHHFIMNHMNCRVRVHTCDGRYYEGVIVKMENNHLYLRPTGGNRDSRKAYTSLWFGGGLLALSLFALLAIALF
ncbi:hypothetical protein BK133_24640 [Paenibacillus sp. FSL H8-0548]|nr:hypothetical protein BK133_24640 [Paenibacillus sp. FSL H8-0548]